MPTEEDQLTLAMHESAQIRRAYLHEKAEKETALKLLLQVSEYGSEMPTREAEQWCADVTLILHRNGL